MIRVALLAALAAAALSAAAPAEAAGAPRVGRWVGVTKHGINVSFTIHAVGGRRYIANEVALCGTSGLLAPLAVSLGPGGGPSEGWPIDRRGRITALSSQRALSPLAGRLGRTAGRVLVGHGSDECPGSTAKDSNGIQRDWPAIVRRLPGRPVESGYYEISGPFVLGGNVTVVGGAVLWGLGGHLAVPRVPPSTVFYPHCPQIASFEDTWIQPDGSFSATDIETDGPSRAAGRAAGAEVTGTYSIRFPDDPACVTAAQPFTARLVEPSPAPSVGRLVLPPPIPGGGAQPPPAPCGQPTTVTVNPVEAISCFRDRGGGVKSSTATVRLNGLDVVPARGTEVRLNARTAHLTTNGPADVRMPFGEYGTTTGLRVWRGQLDWQLRTVKGFKVRSRGPQPDPTTPPAIDEHAIAGLPITGSAEFAFEPGFTRGKVSVKLPKFLRGITADVAIRTSNAAGAQIEQFKLTFPAADVGRLPLKGASLAMGQAASGAFHWDGTVNVELQPDTAADELIDRKTLELKAELGLGTDGYFRLAASLDGINRQVYRGIFLQRLGLSGQINPIKFGGNIGFSAGPQIDVKDVGKLEAASLDGTYELQIGSPTCYQQTAKGRVVIAELFSYRGKMCSNGLVEGEFGLRTTPIPLVSITGRLTGWVFQDRAFNLEGTARTSFPGAPLAEVVVSSEGIAACLAGTRVGFGRHWRDGRTHRMAGSCGIGPWRAAKPKVARAAQDQAVNVRRGQRVAVFSAVGTSAAPTVTLLGPGGERVTAGATALVNERFVAFQDPATHTSYLAVARPSAGSWRLQVEPGSDPVKAVRTAAPRPGVRIRARVAAGGDAGARRLRYRVAGLDVGKVRFVEYARGVRHVIGATSRSRGTLRFRPAPATAVRRRIVATVVRDGTAEPARTVARFRARTRRAAAPSRVRVIARGLRRVITWSGPRDRAYRVTVRTSDGRRLLFLPDRRHRVTVRPVLRGTRLRATVRALDWLGRPGRARTAWSPPRRKPQHRPPQPCAAAIAHASC